MLNLKHQATSQSPIPTSMRQMGPSSSSKSIKRGIAAQTSNGIKLNPRLASCPTCKALPTQACVDADLTFHKEFHKERLARAAKRQEASPLTNSADYDRVVRYYLPTDPHWYRYYVDVKGLLRDGTISLKECSLRFQKYAIEKRCKNAILMFFEALDLGTSLVDIFNWPHDEPIPKPSPDRTRPRG